MKCGNRGDTQRAGSQRSRSASSGTLWRFASSAILGLEMQETHRRPVHLADVPEQPVAHPGGEGPVAGDDWPWLDLGDDVVGARRLHEACAPPTQYERGAYLGATCLPTCMASTVGSTVQSSGVATEDRVEGLARLVVHLAVVPDVADISRSCFVWAEAGGRRPPPPRPGPGRRGPGCRHGPAARRRRPRRFYTKAASRRCRRHAAERWWTTGGGGSTRSDATWT